MLKLAVILLLSCMLTREVLGAQISKALFCANSGSLGSSNPSTDTYCYVCPTETSGSSCRQSNWHAHQGTNVGAQGDVVVFKAGNNNDHCACPYVCARANSRTTCTFQTNYQNCESQGSVNSCANVHNHGDDFIVEVGREMFPIVIPDEVVLSDEPLLQIGQDLIPLRFSPHYSVFLGRQHGDKGVVNADTTNKLIILMTDNAAKFMGLSGLDLTITRSLGSTSGNAAWIQIDSDQVISGTYQKSWNELYGFAMVSNINIGQGLDDYTSQLSPDIPLGESITFDTSSSRNWNAPVPGTEDEVTLINHSPRVYDAIVYCTVDGVQSPVYVNKYMGYLATLTGYSPSTFGFTFRKDITKSTFIGSTFTPTYSVSANQNGETTVQIDCNLQTGEFSVILQ